MDIYKPQGGDSWWYLQYGLALVRNAEPAVIPSGPVYLVFVGLPQLIAAPEAAVLLIRLLQAVISTLTCYIVYRLGGLIGRNIRAGLIAAAVLAVSPAFIIESGQILTETLFVFILTGGLWLYISTVDRYPTAALSGWRMYGWMALVGIVLGIATLTRAVMLAFPLGLLIHLLMVYGWRKGTQFGLVLLVAFAAALAPWTLYNQRKWGQTIIAAQGFAAFVYLGAAESGWQGPQQTDSTLQQSSTAPLSTDPSQQQQVYAANATSSILSDIPGWLTSRVNQLSGAILQPHGTVFFPGDSLKDMAARWFTTDRSVSGFIRLTQGEHFWPKLAIYVFHAVGMLAGAAGMWLARWNWRVALPLVGFIAYTLLAHFIMYVIPRYLFPLDSLWWVFGGVALAALVGRVSTRRVSQTAPLVKKVS